MVNHYSKRSKSMSKADMVAEMNKLAAEVQRLGGKIEEQTETLNESPFIGGVAFGHIAQSVLANIPLREFAIKATIGFIYGYTLGVVANVAIDALMLLTMPAWINFVLAVLVAMSVIYLALATMPPVVNFLYNTGAKVIGFAQREALAARAWVEETAHDIRQEQAQREAVRATKQ